MARMLPPKFPYPDDPLRTAEAAVFEQFEALEDSWTVIYSLTWHGQRSGRTGDGEADFLLLHPRNGFFVAEVKGGERVFVRDGEWYSKPHGKSEPVRIRDPFEQALAAAKSIDSWLRVNAPSLRIQPFGHFVVFPGHYQEGDISPAGRREIIMDRSDVANPRPALQRISRHWGRTMTLTPRNIDEIVNLLRPSIDFELDARIALEHAQKGIKELTQQQLGVLAAIRRQHHLLVQGTAGTGKTVLAVDSAKFHAASGKRTLFLCYNRPLGERLREALRGVPNLTVGSFHSFARNQVDNASLPYEDFDDIPYLLSEAASLNNVSFDALIVDEAQDFKNDWWEALLELLSDHQSAIIHVFRDSNQDVYEGESFELIESFPPADLTINCRNTYPIASLVHSLGRVVTQPLSADGPSPTFRVVGARSGIEKRVVETIKGWMTESGLEPSEITVLTDSAKLADDWFGSSIGGITFGDGTGATIRVETIQRFKGLESDALICVFDCENSYPDDDPTLERLGYVGFSRARTLLAVLAPESVVRRLQQ